MFGHPATQAGAHTGSSDVAQAAQMYDYDNMTTYVSILGPHMQLHAPELLQP